MAKKWPQYTREESRSGTPPRFKVTVTSELPCRCVIVGRGHNKDATLATVAAVNKLTTAQRSHDHKG